MPLVPDLHRQVPVGPVGPTAPASPAGPVGPVGPTAPASPAGPVRPVAPTAPASPAGSGRAGWADWTVPGSPAVPEDPECLSAPLAPSVPFLLAVRADPEDREVREVREVPSRPVGRCPSPHRTRAPASVRSGVPSCRSSPVDRSCRSSLPSDLPEISGSSIYAEGGFAVRPCAAKYRRLYATAADCGRTSAALSFQAQACFGSPNLSQQTHRPSAGA